MHDTYSRRISDRMTREELFIVCADMLAELRDGHVNLSAPFNTSYYRAWWSDYPQNFNKRLIEESYFNFNYRQSSGMMYGFLENNIGYIYYESFSSPVGEGNLDYALNFLSTANGLVGYISHKTGPGHNDFSEPYAITYRPAQEGRVRWAKPIVVLTNRSTFSAANNFASVMKNLPGVTIVGSVTGGGSGVPFSSELPCGWGFSACSMLDALGESTEGGITPSEGCAVDLDPLDALSGRDTILEKAIEILNN